MKIYIPNSAFLGNIDPFLRGFDPSNPSNLHVTANKRWISVHPLVLCMIASLALRVPAQNITCEELQATSKHYLERMGLLRFLNMKTNPPIKEHEAAGRFIPLSQIQDSKQLTRFITEMIPLLHLEAKPAQSLRYISSELIRNVLEHSHSPHGALVSAQYYKKSHSIRIGIVDSGIGIQKALKQSYPTQDTQTAIQLALSPGITGTTRQEGGTDYNAGAGLFFIKSIASVNRDFFVLYTGDTMYKLLHRNLTQKTIKLHPDPFRDKHSIVTDLPYWEGTAIGIDISLDTTQELDLLLDLIRDAYTKAIRERKKARHRKARFI